MSRPASDAKLLRTCRRGEKEARQAANQWMAERNEWKARAQKLERERDEWKERFDILLRRDQQGGGNG